MGNRSDTNDDRSREHFEQLWAEQGYLKLNADEEWRKVQECYKMSTWKDYALYGVPLIAGVVCVNYAPIEHEMLRLAATAIVVALVFVVCSWIKTVISHAPSASDVKRRVKEECYERYKATGQL